MFTRDGSTPGASTRDRVLAAARKVLAERGVARLRIDAVARTAGVSAGALYRHFDGREDLVLAVVLDSVPTVTALADSDDPSADPRGELLRLIEQVYEHEERMAAVSITVLADEDLHDSFRQKLAAAPGGPDDFTAALGRRIENWREAGLLREGADARAAAATIQARCFHHAVLDRLHGPSAARGSPGSLAAQVADELLR